MYKANALPGKANLKDSVGLRDLGIAVGSAQAGVGERAVDTGRNTMIGPSGCRCFRRRLT